MDTGIIIVTIVFLLIVIFPIVLTDYNWKKRKKSLFHKLTELAQTDNFSITQHEFCSNFVIGLDETANHLFFYKKRETNELAVKINLKDFQNCKISNSKRDVDSNKEHSYVIDKLELCFYPRDRNKPKLVIEVYNSDYDSLSLSGELQLIEKWEKMLNDRLKKLNDAKFAPIPQTEKPIQDVKNKSKKIAH